MPAENYLEIGDRLPYRKNSFQSFFGNFPVRMVQCQETTMTVLTVLAGSAVVAVSVVTATHLKLNRPFPSSFRNGETAQRECFRDGFPADVPGSFLRTSRGRKFGQALEKLENKNLGANIHDPNAQTSMTAGGAKNCGKNSFGLIFRSLPFELLGLHFTIYFLGISGDLISVIPRKKYTFLCLSKDGAHHQLHQNILGEFLGVISFTSVTPENSRGINCVMLMSGISKPVVWGTRGLHPGFWRFSSFPWFPWSPRIQHSTPCL